MKECLFQKALSSLQTLGMLILSTFLYDRPHFDRETPTLPNRGITLDEDVYKNPHFFDPSRYLRGEPYSVAQFGFGRR